MDLKKTLNSWAELNNVLREASEKTSRELLEAELAGEKRKLYVLRIHSRMNRVRAARERAELVRRIK